MDSCQLIRKQTKMAVVHLNQKQLAARWSISEATPERWRSEGIGRKFLKLFGRVLYRQNPHEYAGSGAIRQEKPQPRTVVVLVLVVGWYPASNDY